MYDSIARAQERSDAQRYNCPRCDTTLAAISRRPSGETSAEPCGCSLTSIPLKAFARPQLATDGGQPTHKQDDEATNYTELSGFQRDALAAVYELNGQPDETAYGLAIRERLEATGYNQITRGRLYKNLDQLVEAGALDKATNETDGRSNHYTPTERGLEFLEAYVTTLTTQLDSHAEITLTQNNTPHPEYRNDEEVRR
ncbi:PadR family transcriptional regulator (plasmid) [Halobacterium sp. NMX12-1]|uniref:PadR family transcriptional regulator n=1 Tax=Halobacterium sp. NMX12-1 TaxID=3166650 RepID=A0AAU8C8V0_9EURY